MLIRERTPRSRRRARLVARLRRPGRRRRDFPPSSTADVDRAMDLHPGLPSATPLFASSPSAGRRSAAASATSSNGGAVGGGGAGGGFLVQRDAAEERRWRRRRPS